MECEIGIVLREQHGVRCLCSNRGNLVDGAERRRGTEALAAKRAYVEVAMNEFEILGKQPSDRRRRHERVAVKPRPPGMTAVSAIALAFSP